jgi:tRNA (cmo5U34)-methyltransferase
MPAKSTVEEIRARFDADVERFSNLETGQAATMDAPLCLELVTQAAAAATPHAQSVLDVGCGAGNYTLKLLQSLPDLDCTLVDLSQPMLQRAAQRVGEATSGDVVTIQGDIRAIELGAEVFDVILAAAVLHHLRNENEWLSVFRKLHCALRPGGSLWIFDMIEHSLPAIQALMQARYGDYLAQLKDEAYRDHVFAYIEKEDTPAPLLNQLNWLDKAGFSQVEILHKNSCFAAFGAVK